MKICKELFFIKYIFSFHHFQILIHFWISHPILISSTLLYPPPSLFSDFLFFSHISPAPLTSDSVSDTGDFIKKVPPATWAHSGIDR